MKLAAHRTTHDSSRGMNSVVGYVLLIGITTLSVSALLITGGAAIDQLQGQARIESAEQAFTQLDSQAAKVALGSSSIQTVSLGRQVSSKTTITEDAGWLRVVHINTVTGTRTTITNTTLGAIVYENKQATVAYQGGGVWKARDGGSIMISPPEFHYREATLTLPLVRVKEIESRDSGRISITHGNLTQKFPNKSVPLTQPLKSGIVTVTVKSRYYQGWADYFKSRTDGNVVNLDHTENTVTVKLTAPTEPLTFESALTAVGDSQLKLETSGAADTYNSSKGPYDPSTAEPADIRTAGDVKIENNIDGDVFAQGDITIDGATLNGNACAEGTISNSGSVSGWTNDTSCTVEISNFPAPDTEISSEINVHSGSNNNSATSCISGNAIVSDCTGSDTLTAGTYFLTDGTIENKEIHIDTSSGPVNIVVDDRLKLSGASTEIDIVNSNPGAGVTFYVNGRLRVEGTNSGGPRVETDANQSAALMTVKIPSDHSVKFEKDSHFVGVIYAPGSGCGADEVKLETGAEVFGAIVVGCPDNVETVGTIHYDRALKNTDSITVKNPISYLHVSVNSVEMGK